MAKIRNAEPKSTSGGYYRLLGHEALSELLVKSQSTVISNGTELEKMIAKRANCIENLDQFIDDVTIGNITNGTFLCSKKVVKKSSYKLEHKEPDFLIFSLSSSGRTCYVIELKDGDAFDTKKSSGERESLSLFKNNIGSMIEFKTSYKICAFNQLDKDKIVQGFKNEFHESEVMTGKEFCDLLGIDYLEIINQRKEDAKDNLEYFIETVLKVVEVQNEYEKSRKKVVLENEFYEEEEFVEVP